MYDYWYGVMVRRLPPTDTLGLRLAVTLTCQKGEIRYQRKVYSFDYEYSNEQNCKFAAMAFLKDNGLRRHVTDGISVPAGYIFVTEFGWDAEDK